MTVQICNTAITQSRQFEFMFEEFAGFSGFEREKFLVRTVARAFKIGETGEYQESVCIDQSIAKFSLDANTKTYKLLLN